VAVEVDLDARRVGTGQGDVHWIVLSAPDGQRDVRPGSPLRGQGGVAQAPQRGQRLGTILTHPETRTIYPH
jgi:hypothetical protein